MNPPPIPRAPENKRSFARLAASLSLLAPTIAFLLLVAIRTINHEQHLAQDTAMMLGGAEMLLIVGGITFGFIGLASATREGRKVLWQSIVGLVFNGLLLVLFAIAFASGFARARRANVEATREIRQAEADLNADLKNSFNPKTGITNFEESKLREFQGRVTNALQNLSGDNAKIGQAITVFMGRMNAAMKDYQGATARLREARVLGVVTNQSILADRREIVNQFLAANDELTGFITNGENILRENLQSMNVPPGLTEQTLAGYRSRADVTLPFTTQIRACDDKLGHATLDALNLLDSEWGKWGYDSVFGWIKFQSTTTRDAYNADLSIINSNAQKQVQLQKILIQRQSAAAANDGATGEPAP